MKNLMKINIILLLSVLPSGLAAECGKDYVHPSNNTITLSRPGIFSGGVLAAYDTDEVGFVLSQALDFLGYFSVSSQEGRTENSQTVKDLPSEGYSLPQYTLKVSYRDHNTKSSFSTNQVQELQYDTFYMTTIATEERMISKASSWMQVRIVIIDNASGKTLFTDTSIIEGKVEVKHYDYEGEDLTNQYYRDEILEDFTSLSEDRMYAELKKHFIQVFSTPGNPLNLDTKIIAQEGRLFVLNKGDILGYGKGLELSTLDGKTALRIVESCDRYSLARKMWGSPALDMKLDNGFLPGGLLLDPVLLGKYYPARNEYAWGVGYGMGKSTSIESWQFYLTSDSISLITFGASAQMKLDLGRINLGIGADVGVTLLDYKPVLYFGPLLDLHCRITRNLDLHLRGAYEWTPGDLFTQDTTQHYSHYSLGLGLAIRLGDWRLSSRKKHYINDLTGIRTDTHR